MTNTEIMAFDNAHKEVTYLVVKTRTDNGYNKLHEYATLDDLKDFQPDLGTEVPLNEIMQFVDNGRGSIKFTVGNHIYTVTVVDADGVKAVSIHDTNDEDFMDVSVHLQNWSYNNSALYADVLEVNRDYIQLDVKEGLLLKDLPAGTKVNLHGASRELTYFVPFPRTTDVTTPLWNKFRELLDYHQSVEGLEDESNETYFSIAWNETNSFDGWYSVSESKAQLMEYFLDNVDNDTLASIMREARYNWTLEEMIEDDATELWTEVDTFTGTDFYYRED